MTTDQSMSGTSLDHTALQQAARDHLWMHFTRMSSYDSADVPIIVRGEGPYIYDNHGKRYLDALAGLFVSQLGHGRTELAEAAAKQAAELAFFPLWSYAHPGAIDLAERVAAYAPGDLNRVFFTTGGGDAVETAWKLAKQFFKMTGKPTKHKVISRAIAYHGTPQGALSITGLPGMKAPFEPLVPSTFRVPNTNFYRAAETSYLGPDDEYAFGQWAAARRLLEREARTNLWQAAALGLVDRVGDELARNEPTQEDLDNALWCAAHGGQRATAELLLERGANPSWVGHDELTAAAAAERSGAHELAAWLRER